jgi:hypothetical protein
VKLSNVLGPLFICAGLAVAQQPANPPVSGDAHKSSNSMTGCLAKGSAAGEFVLTDETGKQTFLVSTDDLSKHIAHKVRVTGSETKQDEKSAFRVKNVEHLADSCK